jgi:ATP-dependent DNA helicase DinG
VVDIESTGTNQSEDKIFQIGIAIVEKNEVSEKFSFNINPAKKIPKPIEVLTGITNKDVEMEPFFEEVAPMILNILEGKIFVAHNIQFDYQFLNSELRRSGFPELTNEGIDTVELAQILFPTFSSYKLSDISALFDFEHDHPHHADSDALVTAYLLIELQKRLDEIPLRLLEQLASLSTGLIKQTGDFIAKRFAYRKENDLDTGLPDRVHQTRGILLRDFSEVEPFQAQADKFPRNRQSKNSKIASKGIEISAEQNSYMNKVYKHFSTDEKRKNLFIEASTGIGKSFGYLYPLSYLATPENKFLVATANLILQEQLYTRDLPFLNEAHPDSLQAVLVKGVSHYIDLARFFETLDGPSKQKQYMIYQMAVLVWLMDTTTGDLDELPTLNRESNFYRDVSHRGLDKLDRFQEFYADDFLRRLKEKVDVSSVIITNHAFMVSEDKRTEPFLPPIKNVIIDEAHHLPDTLEHSAQREIATHFVDKKMKDFLLEDGLLDEITQRILPKMQHNVTREIKYLRQILGDLEFDWLFYFETLTEQVKFYAQNTMDEFIFTEGFVQHLHPESKKSEKRILSFARDFEEISRKLEIDFQSEEEHFSLAEKLLIEKFTDFLEFIRQSLELYQVFVSKWDSSEIKWCKPVMNQSMFSIELLNFADESIEKLQMYQNAESILFTSGTLRFGTNKDYFPEVLGIKDYQFQTIEHTKANQKQSELFVVNDMPDDIQKNLVDFAKKISKLIEKMSVNLKQPMLVLFTNHELLSKVYYDLHFKMLNKGVEVLAQNISGSRAKILKRFQNDETAILLGADSFWEGIDLPGRPVKLLIVTKLPFENPKNPFIEQKYNYLKERGIQPFFKYSVPKAGIRLRQGFGRMIRSKEDKGIMVLLDQRILTKNYGKKLLTALPENLEVKEMNSSEVVKNIENFFDS